MAVTLGEDNSKPAAALAFGSCTNVCIECIGQYAQFVCSNRTLKCPPGSYKLHRLSAPIYTALFAQDPKAGAAAGFELS